MDTLLDMLKLHILISLPQTYINLLFVFSFLQRQPRNLYPQLAIFALAHAVYTDVLNLFLPPYLQLINSQFAFIVLFYLLFKDLTVKQKLYLYLFSNVFAIAVDLISLAVIMFLLDIPNRESLFHENLHLGVSVVYPEFVIILAASWFIRKRNVFSAKKLFAFVLEGERSELTKVIVLMISQFALLAALLFIQYSSDEYKPLATSIITYMVIIISFYALLVILRVLIRTREQAVLATQAVYVEDINDMFTSIRGQRHDFLNHVQVIHTMAQMGKTEQLKSYVGDLVKETRDVTEIVHSSSPALAAFIQAKLTVALGKGISFTYELPDIWNVPQSSVRIIDIVKIMGNLVDNAFDESMLLPAAAERKVHASVQLKDNCIYLEVSNKGRVLDDKEMEQIFISGYSTKGEGHSGLGLAIVMERIKHYRGEITVECSNDQTTSFRVKLPIPDNGVL